jgi:Serine carboxypeptidase
MAVTIKTLMFASIFSCCSIAQFVKPPTGLKTAKGYANTFVRYKQVPAGICELRQDMKSYSGYVDVGVDQHIFWWFFEAREDSAQKPLTVWLNGGPGSTSVIILTNSSSY